MLLAIPNRLEINKCSISFPGVKALDNVNFHLKSGECHALVGENGAGKSTLCKIIYGVYHHYTGEIRLEGQKVFIRDPHHAQKLGISAVHQELQLIPEMNGYENIFLGRYKKRTSLISWPMIRKQAEEILNFLGCYIDLGIPVKKLRTAEKQIVQLARALSLNARIIILDELTSVLQEKDIKNVFRIINLLKDQNISIIYISHRLDEVFQVCDRYTVLCDGRVMQTGFVNQVSKEELIRLMIGRDLKTIFPPLNDPMQEVSIEVRNLSSKAFSNVTFVARKGEVVGIAGLIGAGKTEFVNALFGSYRCSGLISIKGREVKIRSPYRAVRLGLGLVPDERRILGLVATASVKKNITLPSLREFRRGIFIDRRAEEGAVKKLVNLLKIDCYSPEQIVQSMSGGNQQKVVFAKWLLSKADVLLLDEPTRGIDVGAKAEIYKIINQLSKEGKTVILVSPELEELIGLCHRVYVMFEGKIIAEVDKDNKQPEILIKHILGESRNESQNQTFKYI